MPPIRRLAAILAVDVAGYSRLMGADEEGTHQRLKAHLGELVEPKIAEHRGRIVKNTGDGFLAEFASVVDAVRCAVEVQRGMVEREPETPEERRIRFRIGVNLGDGNGNRHGGDKNPSRSGSLFPGTDGSSLFPSSGESNEPSVPPLHRVPFALGDDADEALVANDPDTRKVVHRAFVGGDRPGSRDRRPDHPAMQHPRHLHVGDIVEFMSVT
jgi:hypothetical protein